jgi:hypothetical protein
MRKKDEETKKELDEFVALFKKQSHRITRLIKEDFVSHQTEQFRLNKQITILNKEKLQLENDI